MQIVEWIEGDYMVKNEDGETLFSFSMETNYNKKTGKPEQKINIQFSNEWNLTRAFLDKMRMLTFKR